MHLVSLLFGFSGRINRAQYWLGCVIAGIGGATLFFVLAALTMPEGGVPKTALQALQAVPSMALAFGAPLVLMGWSGSALQTKRLHDRGRGALWAMAPFVPLIMIVVNIVSGFSTGMRPEQVAASLMMWVVISQIVNVVMFVDIGCMAGKPEANRFGPPPGRGFSGTPPTPGAATPPKSRKYDPAIGSTLTGAETAIERAIAAQKKAPPLRKPASALRTAPQMAPVASPTPAGASFGRKPSR